MACPQNCDTQKKRGRSLMLQYGWGSLSWYRLQRQQRGARQAGDKKKSGVHGVEMSVQPQRRSIAFRGTRQTRQLHTNDSPLVVT